MLDRLSSHSEIMGNWQGPTDIVVSDMEPRSLYSGNRETPVLDWRGQESLRKFPFILRLKGRLGTYHNEEIKRMEE